MAYFTKHNIRTHCILKTTICVWRIVRIERRIIPDFYFCRYLQSDYFWRKDVFLQESEVKCEKLQSNHLENSSVGRSYLSWSFIYNFIFYNIAFNCHLINKKQIN